MKTTPTTAAAAIYCKLYRGRRHCVLMMMLIDIESDFFYIRLVLGTAAAAAAAFNFFFHFIAAYVLFSFIQSLSFHGFV